MSASLDETETEEVSEEASEEVSLRSEHPIDSDNINNNNEDNAKIRPKGRSGFFIERSIRHPNDLETEPLSHRGPNLAAWIAVAVQTRRTCGLGESHRLSSNLRGITK